MAAIVGLCGNSGSGKGYVCRLFLQYGIPSVDTDALYRRMTAPASIMSPCMLELMRTFGEEIVNPDGSLNRTALCQLVFSDESGEMLRRLNEVSHKYILNETLVILGRMLRMGASAVLIDAPVLFESRLDGLCDCLIAVTADRETKIERIMARDHLTREQAERRLSVQLPDDELIRRCTYSINNGKDAAVEEQVKRLAAVLTT